MSESLIRALCQGGAFATVAFAAVGSGLGAGIAGSAAIGAWKRCYGQNKPAPFLLLTFAGAPLSQTIYGFIIMLLINQKIGTTTNPELLRVFPLFLMLGFLGGIAMGVSAWMQGVAGAAACDAYAETGKGFVNNLMILGIVETVAIFTLGFSIVLLLSIKEAAPVAAAAAQALQ